MAMTFELRHSCVLDRKTSLYLKNCTKDTLLMTITEVDTLEDFQFWPELAKKSILLDKDIRKDWTLNKAIIRNLKSPDSVLFSAPRIFRLYDTYYIYAIKWDVIKKYSFEEISKRKLYDRQTITKDDFRNRWYEYKGKDTIENK